LKIITIIGARPQFIKAAPVSSLIRESGMKEFILHTGQHYDEKMSQIFFHELGLRKPDLNIGIGSGTHGEQTGKMLIQIEKVLLEEQPDLVLVYGDTNSTLAGVLAACKMQIKVAHIEAGLRSFNKEMPEEHNRIVADHCADILLCPTQTAMENLKTEGVQNKSHLVGDTMFDAVIQFVEVGKRKSRILKKMKLESRQYFLATVHRPYNTDVPENLLNIIESFQALDKPVVFPVHPRTRQKMRQINEDFSSSNTNLRIIEPVGYLDMLSLQSNAKMILTDSGGIQKEAFFLKVPCITMRPETEWIETVESGWNVITGASKLKILKAVTETIWPEKQKNYFGDGHAAYKIVNVLADYAEL
jgi:UDP-N-acetylglucosamine 2-epimerase